MKRILFLMLACSLSGFAQKYVGISYSNWFSTTDVSPNYITWGGAGEPIGSKVWGVPLVGYYSSKDLSVIDQHAEWLSDAGVDFVMMDLSNSGFQELSAPSYSTAGFKADKFWIEDAALVFADRMAWRKSQGLPYVKVAVMIGALGNCENVTNGFLDRAASIIKTWYIDNAQRNSVYFYYKGKPLLNAAVIGCAVYFPANGSGWGWGDTPLVPFDRTDFTVRHVNDHNALAGLWNPATGQSHKRLWSWGERYIPTNNPPLIPSYMADNGKPEFQIIQAGERGNGGWGGPEGRGREGGQTFKDYWAIARERNVEIAFVQSWNEWTGTAENPGEESTPEYSNDIEPSTAHGRFYLNLMKEEIYKFKGWNIKNSSNYWHFAGSAEGWNAPKNASVAQSTSKLDITITGSDPQLFSPDNLDLKTSEYKYAVFQLRNQTSDNKAELFWTTTADQSFSASKKISFDIVPNDVGQRYYIVDLSSSANWTGTLKQLRFDPAVTATSGLTRLDMVKLTSFYPSTMPTIPGTIEIEDFNKGGQGNAYNETDASNNGGQYRTTEGVDIENCSEGGFNIGWTATGEWMEYLVNVTKTASYDFVLRAASSTDGNQFHLEVDEVDVTGVKTINTLGGLQTYFDIKNTISLTQGKHMVRLVIDKATGGFNLNKMVFTVATTTGLEDEESSNLISVYPNPANNVLNVQIHNSVLGQTLYLLSATGEMVLTKKMENEGILINVQDLSSGVYMLKVGNAMHKVVLTK